MFYKRSVSAKIAIYTGGLILVMCVGLGLLAYYNGSSAVLEEVERALLMQAEQAGEYIESRFETQLSILEVLAERNALKGMNWEEQRLVLQEELDRSSTFLALGVVDPTGLTRYNDGSTANLGNREYVASAFNGKSVVSDVIVSQVTNGVVLMYAVPIKVNNKVVGVLVGRRDASVLSDITDGLGFGSNGWAYIIGSNGTLFAYPERQVVLNQENIFNESGQFITAGRAIQAFGLGKSGVIRYRLNDGASRIVGLAPVDSTGWTIGVGAMETDVLGNVNQLRIFLIWVSLIFIALGAVASIFIGRHIANPLQKVQEVIEAVADGDLTKTVVVKSQDEVGRVAAALNTTIESIRNAMSLVSATTSQMAGTSEQMAAASQEVSASVEEVASTTNQFSSTLDLMNANAQTMSNTALEVSNRAAEGEKAIEGVVEEMSTLRDSTRQLTDDVSSLGSLSGEIGNIVNVISAIADQTNLLALNAAIEAARAGDHGRGFAVVAEEVRKLAEQSAKATSEITSLIGQIQGGISSTVAGMSESAEHAEHALDIVVENGKLLHGILEAVDGIVGQVQEISAGLEQINSGGHEIASATEEQAASMQQVATSAQDLTDIGTKLQELVGHFVLEN